MPRNANLPVTTFCTASNVGLRLVPNKVGEHAEMQAVLLIGARL
jgi:hypothetical protein